MLLFNHFLVRKWQLNFLELYNNTEFASACSVTNVSKKKEVSQREKKWFHYTKRFPWDTVVSMIRTFKPPGEAATAWKKEQQFSDGESDIW